MSTHLLRFFLLAALIVRFNASYGQNKNKLIKEPLYIVNSNIIYNGLVSNLGPADIKNVSVYKGNKIPKVLDGISDTGVIQIETDKDFKSISFIDLAHQHGMQGPFRVVIDGHTLDAAQTSALRIAPEAIGQVQVAPATATTPEAVLIVQLAKPKEDSQKTAPGTIMLR